MLFLSHFLGWYYTGQVKLVEIFSASEYFYAVQLFFTKVSLFKSRKNVFPGPFIYP